MSESNLMVLWQDSKLFGSAFLGGVVGNWAAAAGQWAGGQSLDLVKRLTDDDLRLLLANHHLMRVVRIAQCRAMQAVCVRCLENDYQQAVPFLKTEVSEKLWQRIANAEIRSVLWWMKQFEAEARRAESMEAAELDAELKLQRDDIPALQRAGAEIGEITNFDELRARITRSWIEGLQAYAQNDLERNPPTQLEHTLLYVGILPARIALMPDTLKIATEVNWFDFLRVAFRELLKSGKHNEANIAFQNDILARLSDAPSLDQIEKLFDTHDTHWAQRWRDSLDLLEEITANVDDLLKLARQNQRDMRELPRRVADELKKDLAELGKTPADLSQSELERELASRVPNLTTENLQRLIGYALFKADISRITEYVPAELIGREAEIELLNDAWAKVHRHEVGRPHILSFVALGGEGKTSLVAKWAAELAAQDWPVCDVAFAWSFYSQGTREQVAASSDIFLREALIFFGDAVMAESAAGAFDKGRRLAQLIGERRALLILDGLEPLQYPPHPPHDGALKDDGIATLLKGLAANSNGLCIVTTRYTIPDLRTYRKTTAPEVELMRLSKAAGVALLRKHGVTGAPAEFEDLVEDVQGHALTLNLLGGFLKRAFNGDIRKRDRIKFERADEKIQGGHAFRAMGAYVKWMEDESEDSQRELAVLRLLGLFDRPATASCIGALRQTPAITGLTEPLVEVSEEDWEFTLSCLEEAKLLTINRDEVSRTLDTLDAHPLLREYFAKHLREQLPEVWRTAHQRLYEHLCTTTKEGDQPTLEDLQPLYQAVAHGCQAGLQQAACDEVYFARINQGQEFYSTRILGAYGSDLGGVACFFTAPWRQVSTALTEADQSWLLGQAAHRLRALGRLTEALEPMGAALEMVVRRGDWQNAGIFASNLSQLALTLGKVTDALKYAEQSVKFVDLTNDESRRFLRRTIQADALHQMGQEPAAKQLFIQAEQMQTDAGSRYRFMYSVQGFLFCDLLLSKAEQAAWKANQKLEIFVNETDVASVCHAVTERAAQTLEWVKTQNWLLDVALDHLTLGRAALYLAILNLASPDSSICSNEINAAVFGLRRAGVQDYLPRALLTRAWLRALTGQHTGHESAQSDLNEAWEIAERGPMLLHMADIHLYRARLFCREATYPWESPQRDLAEARRLIEQCGYWRRKEELEDAEAAIPGK